MFLTTRNALKAGAGTERYPRANPSPGPAFRGKVEIDFSRCQLSGACADACPTPALVLERDPSARRATLSIDLGHCIFCGLCEEACEEGAVRLTDVFELAARKRDDLVTKGVFEGSSREPEVRAKDVGHAEAMDSSLRRRVRGIFGRSLHIRHIDAGSCNACETETYATSNPVHDLTRFGIDFVSSPRHADLLLVSGPVTRAISAHLQEARTATPDPKLVVAVGACAIGGGIFRDAYGQTNGVTESLPVDVFIPGCPPRPQAILQGLLIAIGRMTPMVQSSTWRGPYPTRP